MKRIKLLDVDRRYLPHETTVTFYPFGCLLAFIIPFALCAAAAGIMWLVCWLEGLR